MQITGLVKTTTIDFPGRLAAAVFTAGCNYACGYCQNKAFLSGAELIREEEIWAFLEKRAGLLDGVVVSGGEPTLQPDIVPFIRRIRRLGYDVKLDTNGSRPEVLRQLLEERLVQYVAIDYKAPFERYTEICGCSAQGVRECIHLLRNADAEWEMRTTMIPEVGEEDLLRMADAIPALPRYALQLYRPVDGSQARYTPLQIRELGEKVRFAQPNVEARC